MMCASLARLLRRLSISVVFALSGVWFAQRPAASQTFDATTLRQPTDMGMTWLVTPGDDPAYARPDYDDSRWMRVNPNRSLKEYFAGARPNVLWYRLHVKVAPNQTGLALEEFNLSSAFEIYANGERLFANGQIAPFHPYTFGARLLKRIPAPAIATGTVVVAMRLYVSNNEWVSSHPGLFPYNLVIGDESALSDHVWLTTIGDHLLEWFYQLAGLGLGIIALALFAAQRRQQEYLWIFLFFLANALHSPFQFYLLFHTLPSWSAYVNACFDFATIALLTIMFIAFLRTRVKLWLQVVLALAVLGILFNAWLTASGNGSPVSILVAITPAFCLLAGILPALLIVHWRRGNREAGILLVPAIVSSLATYLGLGVFVFGMIPAFAGAVFRFQSAIFDWRIGPFTVDVRSFDDCLFALSLAVILVLRSARIAQHQAHLETELAAAQEVQQIILPEQVERVPGFAIESAYVPAQQVGGDFFQILPAPEGSLLLVVGDVAGKGLPAAMLVSVLVGAIRGVSDYTAEPAELLANLNQRLVGRVAGGFSTALAARLFADGSVVMANAGHLPPYLDGHEVQVLGALPLGAKAGTRYDTIRFQLPRGSRLTFYSDGIIEAQNAKGELFGFDRGRELAMEPVAAIVEAAQNFGQHDDMTVIAITREAAAERDAARAQKATVGAPALAS